MNKDFVTALKIKAKCGLAHDCGMFSAELIDLISKYKTTLAVTALYDCTDDVAKVEYLTAEVCETLEKMRHKMLERNI